MIHSSLTALQGNFDALAKGVDQYTRLDYFNDGADVFGATPFRCFPQFFFYLHLPNQWHRNTGQGWTDVGDVNLSGPILALGIIAYILGAGYYFMKCEETRHVKNLLKEEVLIAYYTLKKKAQTDAAIQAQFKLTFENMDRLILEQIERDKRIQFGYWFYRLMGWKYEGYEERRINHLKGFAETHCDEIYPLLTRDSIQESNPSLPSDPVAAISNASRLRQAWEKTYDVFQYYSYAHWILWMISTLVLYQTQEGYGYNPADPRHSDAPSFFTDDATGFSEYNAALLFQTVVPFIFSLLIVWNKSNAKQEVVPEAAFDVNNDVRAFYLQKTQGQGNAPAETHHHFYLAQGLTALTTFISTFIVLNVAAWPIQGFAMEVCDFKTKDTTYIPTIFAFTALAGMINAALKVYDLKKEENAYFAEKGSISIQQRTKPTLWQFWTSHEHAHKAWYNGPGLMFGSGGLLLTRILLNGGMGNLRADGVKAMARMDILYIGLGVAAALIFIKCAQYYALTDRQNVLKCAADEKRCAGKSIR